MLIWQIQDGDAAAIPVEDSKGGIRSITGKIIDIFEEMRVLPEHGEGVDRMSGPDRASAKPSSLADDSHMAGRIPDAEEHAFGEIEIEQREEQSPFRPHGLCEAFDDIFRGWLQIEAGVHATQRIRDATMHERYGSGEDAASTPFFSKKCDHILSSHVHILYDPSKKRGTEPWLKAFKIYHRQLYTTASALSR
jgi:hypothetical protein